VDLVVSGINRGANVGINIIYSERSRRPREGAIMGVPSMAVSLDSYDSDADFSFAAKFAGKMAAFSVERSFPEKYSRQYQYSGDS